MTVFSSGTKEAADRLSAPFITCCGCGRIWNVKMERGKPGNAGCVRCSCEAELVSWSGSVIFNAVPVDAD